MSRVDKLSSSWLLGHGLLNKPQLLVSIKEDEIPCAIVKRLTFVFVSKC